MTTIRVAEGKIPLDEAEKWLNNFVNIPFSNTRKPDLNIILTAPLEDIVARCESRGTFLSQGDKDFLAKAQDLIIKVASKPENNAVCIPVQGLSIDELSRKIIETINSELALNLSISNGPKFELPKNDIS